MQEPKITKSWQDARGWLTMKERIYLYRSAQQMQPPDGWIIEVGAEFGASTVCFRQGNPRAKILSIDLFPKDLLSVHLKEIEKAGVWDTFQLRGDSKEVGQILPAWIAEIVFVDGDHHYEGALADARLYCEMVNPGGLLIFHDYHGDHPLHAEVRQAVDEWLEEGNYRRFEEAQSIDSMRIFRKERK